MNDESVRARGGGKPVCHGNGNDAPVYAGNPANACFSVVLRNGDVETHGPAHAEFGHHITSARHPVDDGIFAGWRWDGAKLVVHNDRYGLYPLFWCHLPNGGVAVSPSLVTLVEHGAPAELDLEALALFLELGWFLGADTPFRTIKALPPNAVFEWHDGKLRCEARLPTRRQPLAVSRDDAIDEYIRLFAQSMARRAPASPRFAVPISGGRDSRHILLELHRTGHVPEACVSALDNPPDPNQDPVIAARLCEAINFKLTVVGQRLPLLAAEVRKNRETHFCSGPHGWYLALADFLNGRFDCCYDGIAGDVFSQSQFLNESFDAAMQRGDATDIARYVATHLGAKPTWLAGMLRGNLRAAVLDESLTIGRIAQEIGKHLDAPNPIASFIFWNRTRRQIALAPFSLLGEVPRVHAPFLDHDLFDFLSALPSGLLLDHAFHSDAISRAYPAYADIPYANHKTAPRTDASKVRARLLRDATRHFLLRRPSALMKNATPRLRMLAGALSHGRSGWWMPPLAIYLDQLEALSRGEGGRPHG